MPTESSEETIAEQLREQGVRRLILTMIDQAGINRVKLLPEHRIPAAIRRGVSFSLTSAVLLCSDDAIADLPEFPQAMGDVRLYADLDALRVIDSERGVAWAPADQYTPEGTRFEVCQRAAVSRQVSLAGELGLELSVAFEVEFTLYRGTFDDPVPAHTGPAYGLDPLLGLEDWAHELLDRLDEAGIAVEQLHPEYGTGQVELSIRPGAPLTAADEYVLTKLIIARVSRAHGLLVSFAPLTSVGGIGNGCHIHLSAAGRSAEESADNVFADGPTGQGMTVVGERMVAGLVRHLPEAIALLAPSINSYERLQPGHYSGALACWGIENREAAVRYIPGAAGRRSEGANLEIKVADGAANPYLAVATIIACALAGIHDQLPLPAPVEGRPDLLEPAVAEAAQVRRFPANLDLALAALDKSRLLRDALGETMINSYLGIRRHEWDAYAETPLAERLALLRWKH